MRTLRARIDPASNSHAGPRRPGLRRTALKLLANDLVLAQGILSFKPSTNSIESLNYELRKIINNRGHFPNDEAVIKLLWLAICTIEEKRTRDRANEHSAWARCPRPRRQTQKPKDVSSKAKSPPAGSKPSPNSPSSTPTESTPTYDQNHLPYTKDLTGSVRSYPGRSR